MKQIKRIMAFALALVLTLAMGITVFAEDGKTYGTPKDTDTATITVKGVESGLTVTAYKYVEAKYNDDGLVGYAVVEAAAKYVTNYETSKITAEEITDLSGNTTGLESEVLEKQADDSYTAKVKAGSYLILVTGASDKVYNPMVVSVYYNQPEGSGSDNKLSDGSVDAGSSLVLQDAEAYAKSEEVSVTKKIVSVTDTGKKLVDTTDFHDAAIGDTVAFEIDTKIPSYSAEYSDGVTFKLTDTLDTGFTGISDVAVKVGDNVVENAATVKDNTITIDLSSIAYANKGSNVVVTYNAVVDDDAAVTAAAADAKANINKVTLEYSTSLEDTKEKDVETYTYTFDLNNTDDADSSIITKVDANGDALKGATFTLTNDTTGREYTAVSDENGIIAFDDGLDAGTYTLKETKAPNGYSLNDTEYRVEITAGYDETSGALTSLSATFYYKDADGNYQLLGGKVEIEDTALASLPSTGGIGTTIFTIAGCLIMIAAACMYFASRRRNAK
jgi:fimbrial isopeptide formation D2 family protein/LPXTG-motif cell wall-anchored protein